jgi:hypothetical protein
MHTIPEIEVIPAPDVVAFVGIVVTFVIFVVEAGCVVVFLVVLVSLLASCELARSE